MYSCKICPCRFAHRYSLTRHEITHSNIRFPCNVCSKLFKYNTNLKRHEKNSHPDVFKRSKTRRRTWPVQIIPPTCVQNCIPLDRPIEMSPIDLKRTNDYSVNGTDFANSCSYYSQTSTTDYYQKSVQRSCNVGNESIKIFKSHETTSSEIDYIDLTESTSPSPQDLSITSTLNNGDGSLFKLPETISSKIEHIDPAEKISISPQDLSIASTLNNGDGSLFKLPETISSKIEHIDPAEKISISPQDLSIASTLNNGDGSVFKSPETISSKIEHVDVAEKILTSPKDLSITGTLNNETCVSISCFSTTWEIKAETANTANENECSDCSLEDDTKEDNVKIEPTSLELILERNREDDNIDENARSTEPVSPNLMAKQYMQAKEYIDEQKKIISAYENEIKILKNTIRILMDQMKNLSTK